MIPLQYFVDGNELFGFEEFVASTWIDGQVYIISLIFQIPYYKSNVIIYPHFTPANVMF